MSIARPHPEPSPIPFDERVGRDRRVLRRLVEENVGEVRDRLDQIAALIRAGELDAIGPGGVVAGSERYERLRNALEVCLPALDRFLGERS